MNKIEEFYRSGKPVKPLYFAGSALRMAVPRWWRCRQRRQLLQGWEMRPDADYIRQRVDFYCRLKETGDYKLSEVAERVDQLSRSKGPSAYWYDLNCLLRYFPAHLRIDWFAGDVWNNPDFPTVQKARRLDDKADNGVILNLNRVRHFLHPHDNIPFVEKMPMLVFRGDIYRKPLRRRFFERFFNHPLCDLGETRGGENPEWHKPRISIPDHFRYRFVLVIEGNDVASALQWVMASNCVPVMTAPTAEHWLMHSRLQPGVHYVEINSDFSDLDKKLRYYITHVDEAELISEESKKWYAQFSDNRRELIISLLVLEKYFRATGQNFE